MKLNSLLFCEDVRKELYGTHTIVGQFNALRGYLGERYTFKVFFSVTDFIGVARLKVVIKSPEGVELKRFVTNEIVCTTRDDHSTGFFTVTSLWLRSYGRYTITVSHNDTELSSIKMSYMVKDFKTNIIMFEGKSVEVPRVNLHDNRELFQYSKLFLRKFRRLEEPYKSIEFRSQFMSSDGIGSVSCHLINEMIRKGIKVKPIPIYADPQSNEYINSIPNDKKISDECDITIVNSLPSYLKDVCNAKRILLFTYWEASRVNKGWSNISNTVDGIFVPSKYVKEIYKNSGVNVPIFVYKQPIDSSIFRYERIDKDEGDKGYFDILFLGTCISRKGVDIFTKAVDEVFGDDSKVRIRMHVKPWSEALGDTSRELNRKYKNNKQYLITNNILSTIEIARLIQQSDLVVTPSRSEGLGLIPLQSVLCGTPTIVPDHSGFKEYNHKPGFIKIEKSKIVKAEGIYAGGEWYEPDFIELCEKLEYVKDNHSKLLEEAKKGSELLSEEYNVSSTYSILEVLMNNIYANK